MSLSASSASSPTENVSNPADETCIRCVSLIEQLTDIKLTQNNIESELLFLRKENDRLRKIELQFIALKMGQNQRSAQLPVGYMGYGISEW